MLKGTSNVEHEFFPPPILPSLSVSMCLYSGFYVIRSSLYLSFENFSHHENFYLV